MTLVDRSIANELNFTKMKKITFLIVFSLIGFYSFGQWTTDGNYEKTDNSIEVKGNTMLLGETAGTGDARVEIGGNRSGDGPAYFGLVGDGSNFPGYGARLIRWADGTTYFTHRGSNTFGLFCPQGALTVFNSANKNTMVLTADNKVGIGTNNPQSLLSVKGGIESQEVQVKATVADYVFADDYELMPLEELEKFINENNHLPNMQNDAQVAENRGLVKLGELSISLMEKVEELTLHVIELNKKIKKLENELEGSK